MCLASLGLFAHVRLVHFEFWEFVADRHVERSMAWIQFIGASPS
jgi:hypothetical protein